jgi:hypothetical protein
MEEKGEEEEPSIDIDRLEERPCPDIFGGVQGCGELCGDGDCSWRPRWKRDRRALEGLKVPEEELGELALNGTDIRKPRREACSFFLVGVAGSTTGSFATALSVISSSSKNS